MRNLPTLKSHALPYRPRPKFGSPGSRGDESKKLERLLQKDKKYRLQCNVAMARSAEVNSANKRVSVGSLAKQLKLSPSTVSRALRSHPTIAPKTIEMVNSLAKELGYQARREVGQYFRSLKKEVNAVDFLVDRRAHEYLLRQDSFYTRILWAIQRALRAENVHMLLSCLQDDILANGSLYSIEEGMANGVIAKVYDDKMIARVAEHAPVVVLDYESTLERVDSVLTDVARAVRKQIDYLVALGHRDIACFRLMPTVAERHSHTQDGAFWTEYVEHSTHIGLTIPQDWLEPMRFTPESENEVIGLFIDRVLRTGRPTAILTTDVYATPLIEVLRNRGLSVPEDISIVGFDDHTFGRVCPVPLTTFRQDFEAMAAEAVNLMKDRIKNRDRSSRVIKIEGEHILRQSACSPKSRRTAARR